MEILVLQKDEMKKLYLKLCCEDLDREMELFQNATIFVHFYKVLMCER